MTNHFTIALYNLFEPCADFLPDYTLLSISPCKSFSHLTLPSIFSYFHSALTPVLCSHFVPAFALVLALLLCSYSALSIFAHTTHTCMHTQSRCMVGNCALPLMIQFPLVLLTILINPNIKVNDFDLIFKIADMKKKNCCVSKSINPHHIICWFTLSKGITRMLKFPWKMQMRKFTTQT